MGDIDRITMLPDDLHWHILSLLTTKEAAATAVLSREWGRLSGLLTSLNITFVLPMMEEEENIVNRFTDGLLSRSNWPHPLHKLVIRCPYYQDSRPIERMIEVAVTGRLVQYLQVLAEPKYQLFTLPDAIFTSTHLKHLILGKVFVIPPPNEQGPVFPSLKTLEVDILPYCNKSMRSFYSRCPVLEELFLAGYVDESPISLYRATLQIHSQSVKKLKIKIVAHNELGLMGGHENMGPRGNYSLYTFDIDAPRLEVLVIDEDILASYHLRTFVFEAKLQVGWQDVGYAIPHHSVVNDVFTLLRGITHVRSLTLYDRTIGVAGFLFHHNHHGAFIEDGPHAWALFRTAVPTFPFLKRLKICISHYYGWNFLIYLLDRTPAVEMLEIEMVIKANVAQGNRFTWNPPHSRPPCWMSNLKQVQIKGFQGHEEDLSEVVSYFQNISNKVQGFEILINKGSEGV